VKKIEAVVVPSRVDAVRKELRRRGVCGELTLTEVLHGDTNKPSIPSFDGFDGPLQERVKLELIVADRQVDKAVSLILRYALPEFREPDGHVALLDVSEVLQITHPVSDISGSGKAALDISSPRKG
jgi:nitrogen regulatory protein PII